VLAGFDQLLGFVRDCSIDEHNVLLFRRWVEEVASHEPWQPWAEVSGFFHATSSRVEPPRAKTLAVDLISSRTSAQVGIFFQLSEFGFGNQFVRAASDLLNRIDLIRLRRYIEIRARCKDNQPRRK
jgi:hypothetical protein